MDGTNAERQRRHRAKLKAAAAQDDTGLKREISALQLEVTVLREELARQRAAAKKITIKQADKAPTSVVMEALLAARTKASIGVVSIGIEEQTVTTEEPQIQPWFSEEEQQAIKEAWKSPFYGFDKDLRAALKRLATDDRMGDLRKKLPDGAILLAIDVLGIFPLARLQPKPGASRKAQQKWEQDLQSWEEHCFKHWVKHPNPTMGYDLGTLAEYACVLRDVFARLRYVRPDADELLARHLRRGPLFKDTRYEADYARGPAIDTIGAVISSLHAVYQCIFSMGEEYQSDDKLLPKAAHYRWDHPKTPQRFFMDLMSGLMKKLYDHYHDEEVADLTNVMFVQGSESLVTEETVRGRRRLRGLSGHGMARSAGPDLQLEGRG